MSIWLGNQRLDGIDENAVHKTGDETIAGVKTFTGTVLCPTPATNSNDTTVATTAWVRANAGGSGRSVGDIFYTTRRDTSLAGAVECNGGTYDTRDYTGAGSIGELLAAGKLPYTSLAEYAQWITDTGSCSVFGWDGGTSFRVPTLRDIFIEATNSSSGEVNWYKSAGLPNITATFDVCNTNGGTSASGDITLTGYHNGGYGGGNGRPNSEATATLTPKNSIYGNSHTVQPEAVKYRAMVQLFNGTTDQAVATVGTVVAQVGELNSHRVIEFQAPTAGNGYTWYRKYADGWVEQGGHLTSITTGSNQSISLLVEMLNANYTANITLIGTGTSDTGFKTVPANTTTTRLGYIVNSGDGNTGINWQVSGIAK